METLRTAYDATIAYLGEQPFILLNLFAGILGLLLSLQVVRYLSGWGRRESTVREIGRLKRLIAQKQLIYDESTIHSAMVDRQNVLLSAFTLASGVFFFGLENNNFGDTLLLGFAVDTWFNALAITTTIIALVILTLKWSWSAPFVNFEAWKARKQAKIDRIQRRSFGKRDSLGLSDAEREEVETELASGDLNLTDDSEVLAQQAATSPLQPDVREVSDMPEAPAPEPTRKTGDRYGTFLNSRTDIRLVLAPKIDDGEGNRPWRIGIVNNVGEGGFGFITEKVASPEAPNRSQDDENFYFNYANVCNTVLPDRGDEAFFITVNKAPRTGKQRAAYLVCLRDKPCRAIVRTTLSRNDIAFAEIADGAGNYASVISVMDRELAEAGQRFEVGDEVEGIVSHNNRGMTLIEVRPVSLPAGRKVLKADAAAVSA